MPSKYRPLRDQVLVSRKEVNQSAGGLYLTSAKVEYLAEAVGPDVKGIVEGDILICQPSIITKVDPHNDDLFLIDEKQVKAVVA